MILSRAGLLLLLLLLAQVPFRAKGRIDTPGTHSSVAMPDPTIIEMLSQVDQDTITDLTGNLGGETPVSIGGEPYTIQTRYSLSGESIHKAANYLFEYYQALGLEASYQDFPFGIHKLSNVIAEKQGRFLPERIYLLTAHYDDLPVNPPAPGADDNASGTVGVMVAAEILSQYDFGCTLRFASFAAEEQGLHGSDYHASQAACAGEDIRGVINLDMIAWNSAGSPPEMELHAHGSVPGSTDIASLFQEAVSAYGLDLDPVLGIPAISASDHASFWKYGFPAILAIEDLSDFNPNYHTQQDKLDNLPDLGYYTEMVKAGLAAFAHLGCLVEGETGEVGGTVIDAVTHLPINDVQLTLVNHDPAWGYTLRTNTDNYGLYSVEAVSDWHTLYADGAGYPYTSIGDVYIEEGEILALDLELQPVEETMVYFPLALAGQPPVIPGCP